MPHPTVQVAKAWRARNETPADVKHELEAAQKISDCWGINCLKLGEALYHVDWALHRGSRLVGFGEYKWREQRYPTVMLSYAKFQHGRQLASSEDLTFWLFIEWPEHGLHWVDCSELDARKLRKDIGGNSRGQNGDIEPVIHIPREFFQPLK